MTKFTVLIDDPAAVDHRLSEVGRMIQRNCARFF